MLGGFQANFPRSFSGGHKTSGTRLGVLTEGGGLGCVIKDGTGSWLLSGSPHPFPSWSTFPYVSLPFLQEHRTLSPPQLELMTLVVSKPVTFLCMKREGPLQVANEKGR